MCHSLLSVELTDLVFYGMFYIILLCFAILQNACQSSKLVQCFYIIRGIRVNFTRHLGLFCVVSRCLPLRSGATLSSSVMSVPAILMV